MDRYKAKSRHFVQKNIVEKRTTIYQSFMSGFSIGMFMALLSCGYAGIIFENSDLSSHVYQISLTQNLTVFFGAVIFALYSKCHVSIAGPDGSPAIFLGILAGNISSRTNDIDLLPTVLFSFLVAGLSISIMFYAIGRFNLTKVLQFLPASLLSGFLSCVGAKIFLSAIKLSTNNLHENLENAEFWKLLTPSLILGVVLYGMKRKHLTNPIIILLTMILPITVFYSVIFFGLDTDDPIKIARNTSWLIEKPEETQMSLIEFYSTVVDFKHINFDVVAENFGNHMVMVFVVSIDFLLELGGMQSKMDIEIHYNHEMKLAGLASFLSTLGFGSPSYGQKKLTLMNVEFVRSMNKRLPGIICGLFNLALFFSGFPLILYIPRFVLGGLMFNSAFVLIVENVWDVRSRVSREEYGAILAILIVSLVSSILIAVGVGITLSSLIFALAYGRIGVVRAIYNGCDRASSVVRSGKQERKLQQLARGYTVIELHHFIFFGSAAQFLDSVKEIIAENEVSTIKQRFIIVDWTSVDGIDFSGVSVITETSKRLSEHRISVVYTGLKSSYARILALEGVFDQVSSVFPTLQAGVEWVEELLLVAAHQHRKNWYRISCLRRYHELAVNKEKHDVFETILGEFGEDVWPYIDRQTIAKGDTLGNAENDLSLYIVQNGKVQSYSVVDGRRTLQKTFTRGSYLNELSLFLNESSDTVYIASVNNTVVLKISLESMKKMELNSPQLAFAIQKSVMQKYYMTNSRLERGVFDASSGGKHGLVKLHSMSEDSIGNASIGLQGAIHQLGAGIHHILYVDYDTKRGSMVQIAENLNFKNCNETCTMYYRFCDKEIPEEDDQVELIENVADELLEPENQVILRLPPQMIREASNCYQFHRQGKKSSGMGLSSLTKTLQDLGHYIERSELITILEKELNISARRPGSLVQNSKPNSTAKGEQSRDQKVKLVFTSSLAMFSDLSSTNPKLLWRIASIMRMMVYHEGNHILVEGTDSDKLVVVIDGEVVSTNPYETKICSSKEAPVTFEPESLIQNCKCFSSVIAESRTVVTLELHRDQLKNLVNASHSLWETIALVVKFRKSSEKKKQRTRELVFQRNNTFGKRFRAICEDFNLHTITEGGIEMNILMAANTKIVTYPKDDLLCVQNMECKKLIIILNGEASYFTESKPQERSPLVLPKRRKGFQSHIVVDASQFFQRGNWKRSVVVESTTLTTLELQMNVVEALFEKSHGMWDRVQQSLANNEIEDSFQELSVEGESNKTKRKEATKLLRNIIKVTQAAKRATTVTSNDEIIKEEMSSVNSIVKVISTKAKIVKKISTNTITPSIRKVASNIAIKKEEYKSSQPKKETQSLRKVVSTSKLSNFGNINLSAILKLKSLGSKWTKDTRERLLGDEGPLNVTLSEDQFLQVFQHIRLKPLTRRVVHFLKAIFDDYAVDGILNKSSLCKIGRLRNWPWKNEDAEQFFREWFSYENKGNCLSFEEFASVYSLFLKKDELSQEIRALFADIIKSKSEITKTIHRLASMGGGFGIGSQELQNYWKTHFDEELSDDIAKNMVAEADTSFHGYISLHSLIDTLTTVHDSELMDGYHEFETSAVNKTVLVDETPAEVKKRKISIIGIPRSVSTSHAETDAKRHRSFRKIGSFKGMLGMSQHFAKITPLEEEKEA